LKKIVLCNFEGEDGFTLVSLKALQKGSYSCQVVRKSIKGKIGKRKTKTLSLKTEKVLGRLGKRRGKL